MNDPAPVSVTLSAAVGSTALFLLPDCFYLKSSSVSTLYLGSIVVQGNSTYPNPWNRVAAAISQKANSIIIQRSRFVLDTGAPASVDWNGIQSILSSVEPFNIASTDLAWGNTANPPNVHSEPPVVVLWSHWTVANETLSNSTSHPNCQLRSRFVEQCVEWRHFAHLPYLQPLVACRPCFSPKQSFDW